MNGGHKAGDGVGHLAWAPRTPQVGLGVYGKFSRDTANALLGLFSVGAAEEALGLFSVKGKRPRANAPLAKAKAWAYVSQAEGDVVWLAPDSELMVGRGAAPGASQGDAADVRAGIGAMLLDAARSCPKAVLPPGAFCLADAIAGAKGPGRLAEEYGEEMARRVIGQPGSPAAAAEIARLQGEAEAIRARQTDGVRAINSRLYCALRDLDGRCAREMARLEAKAHALRRMAGQAM